MLFSPRETERDRLGGEGLGLMSSHSQAAHHPQTGRPPLGSRVPGPVSHARVGRQRPALAAPADLLHRPGTLPHGLGRRRSLLVGGGPVHLQREGREEGLSSGEAADAAQP